MKAVPRDEFIALLKSRSSPILSEHLPRYDLDMILGQGECAVHEGDLIPPGDWRLPADNLLVLGSLKCNGFVDLSREDGEWGGSLWVFGDVQCRDIAGHFAASMIVDGDLTTSGITVAAFEDSNWVVTGDFTAHFFYGADIWIEVGGRASMEYGDGYALPLGYDNARKQAINPRNKRNASLALLNLEDGEDSKELVAKLRRGVHFRVGQES